MRQHIVADGLRLPQPAAMSDHQPAMRAQHREVIGDGLGVRRPDADVDEGDAVFAIGGAQVIGRHLEPVPGRGRDPRLGRDRVVAAPDDVRRGIRPVVRARGSPSSPGPSARTDRHSAGSWSAGSSAASLRQSVPV